MNHFLLILMMGVVLSLLVALIWRRWRSAQQNARLRLAMLEFEEIMPQLEAQLLQAAAATGKPRGLRWTQCELNGTPLFASDRAGQHHYSMVGVTVSFEAIQGGDMEDVEAVSNLRSATAVFMYQHGQWITEGRVIFNLEPNETLERFQLNPILMN